MINSNKQNSWFLQTRYTNFWT